jgi:hypothetical protein
LASASLPIIGGWLYKKGKDQSGIHRDRYYRTIEIIYSTLHENSPKECLKHLDQLRGQVINLLHDGKITKEDYKELNNRISKHEGELRRKIGGT